MKSWLFFLLAMAWAADTSAQAQTYVTPMMGGGQTPADMVHIDVLYDEAANHMIAQVDTSVGTPMLRRLPDGCEFDSTKPYAVLGGKGYNSQYGWNAGGQFAIPAGAAIWIELLNSSPGLETYSGWGRLASYTPVFGTADAPRLWNWSGVMVHNTYALAEPAVPVQFASYRIYFGEAQTGSRDAYTSYGDTTVTLTWAADLPMPPLMLFGAEDQTNGARLSFINAADFETNSQHVLNLQYTNAGPMGGQFQCPLRLVGLPASVTNGGPQQNHAAPGAHLELELDSVTGAEGAALSIWENAELQPRLTVPMGDAPGTNRIRISENNGETGADPYGAIQGRRIAVSKPGLYCVGFRVVDSSTNGVGGGPIHVPSPDYFMFLQAGCTIQSLMREGNLPTIVFGGESGKNFYLERAAELRPAATWHEVAGPVSGTNLLQQLTDPAPPAGRAFYRVVGR